MIWSRLDRVVDWMQLAKNNHFRLEEIADACEISPSQLRRYFKTVFGQSPKILVNQLRLWEVARLICTTRLSLKEIRAAVFLANESELCRQVAQYFHCRPSDLHALCQRLQTRDGSGLPKELEELATSNTEVGPLWDRAQQRLLSKMTEKSAHRPHKADRRSNPACCPRFPVSPASPRPAA